MKTLSLALLTLLLAVGCGPQTPEPSSSTPVHTTPPPGRAPASATTPAAATTPAVAATPATATPPAMAAAATPTAAPEAGGKKIVAIISPALTSTFHVALVDGFKQEGESYGWDVISQAPDRETNSAAQLNMVEAMVRQKVAAISICAINPDAIVGAVEEANKAGIPIFVHNSLTPLPGTAQVESYIGYDQRKAGKLCGDYAVELLKKKYNGEAKGKVYLLLGIPGFHTTERSGGFRDALKAYPNIQIAGETPANWERQQGLNVPSGALKATPDIDLFFGCSDAMDQGAAQAAKEAGKQVFTIGIDGNPDTFTDIKSGVVTATCAVFPKNMGKVVAQTIKAHLDGKPVSKMVETDMKIVDKASVDAAM